MEPSRLQLRPTQSEPALSTQGGDPSPSTAADKARIQPDRRRSLEELTTLAQKHLPSLQDLPGGDGPSIVADADKKLSLEEQFPFSGSMAEDTPQFRKQPSFGHYWHNPGGSSTQQSLPPAKDTQLPTGELLRGKPLSSSAEIDETPEGIQAAEAAEADFQNVRSSGIDGLNLKSHKGLEALLEHAKPSDMNEREAKAFTSIAQEVTEPEIVEALNNCDLFKLKQVIENVVDGTSTQLGLKLSPRECDNVRDNVFQYLSNAHKANAGS